MHPDREPPDFVGQLVYDVDFDATIGVVSGRVWAYDLKANTWTEKGVAPSGAALGADDPVSGLVVAADIVGEIVRTDTWRSVDLRRRDRHVDPDPTRRTVCHAGRGCSPTTPPSTGWSRTRQRGSVGNDAIWLLDLRTGTWSGTGAATPPDLHDRVLWVGSPYRGLRRGDGAHGVQRRPPVGRLRRDRGPLGDPGRSRSLCGPLLDRVRPAASAARRRRPGRR